MIAAVRRVAATLRRWFSRDRAERELHDDVESYARLLEDEQRAVGVSGDEARRRARIELGGVAQVEEAVRQHRTGALVEQTWQDARYAVRGLRRTPGFTATAALTLGLGIGVNVALFSVTNAALLKPIPYDHPDELVLMAHEFKDPAVQYIRQVGLSWPEVHQWRAERSLFAGVEAFHSGESMEWREGATALSVWRFTAGMPALLGIEPFIGRLFTNEEADRDAPVVLMSDGMWARAFGRNVDAIGKTITLDERTCTVIGVMPPAFRYGPGGGGGADAWLPLSERLDPAMPRSRMASPIFRLRRGVSSAEANRLAGEVGERMQRLQPDGQPWSPVIRPYGDALSSARDGVSKPLTLLLLATIAVLLVVCANMANLLLARAVSRESEMAMRAALGATRRRLARLLFVEVGVIALIGAGLALLCAWGALNVVMSIMPGRLMSSLFVIGLPSLDWRVTMFALGLFGTVILLSGAWPAIRGSRLDAGASRPGGRSRSGRRVSVGLQTTQVALALVLSTVAGLFANSLARVVSKDLGYAPAGLTVTIVQLPPKYSTADALLVTFNAILDRVRSLPDVRGAAIGDPPSAGGWAEFVRDRLDSQRVEESLKTVDAAYLDTVGVVLRAGRNFGSADAAGSEAVALVDETAASELFPGESPLGQRIRYTAKTFNPDIINTDGPPGPWRRIVGVVSPVIGSDFTTRRPHGAVYVPRPQNMSPGGALLVRSRGGSGEVMAAVRQAVVAVVPDARIPSAAPLTLPYDDMVATPRYYAVLISVFAVLALVTAAVGLYGLLAYAVSQRHREIGVRVALGATLGEIRRLVLVDAARPVLAGLGIGWIAAWWLARLTASLLYGVSPHDPFTFAVSGAVLLLSGLVATIGPVRKAAGVDPIRSLRAE